MIAYDQKPKSFLERTGLSKEQYARLYQGQIQNILHSLVNTNNEYEDKIQTSYYFDTDLDLSNLAVS